MSKTVLTKQETKALAMHEIMQREQRIYSLRVDEQRKIAMMSDEKLREIVGGTTEAPDSPKQPKVPSEPQTDSES